MTLKDKVTLVATLILIRSAEMGFYFSLNTVVTTGCDLFHGQRRLNSLFLHFTKVPLHSVKAKLKYSFAIA